MSVSYRINKCLVGYSRRQADALLLTGRVKVNGRVVNTPGAQLRRGDALSVDNAPVAWERHVERVYDARPCTDAANGLFSAEDGFVYLKLWKPMHTVVTTAARDRENVLRLLPPALLKAHRVFPVGRLDRDTTGLLLLSSNPRFQSELLGNRTYRDREKNKIDSNNDSNNSNSSNRDEDMDGHTSASDYSYSKEMEENDSDSDGLDWDLLSFDGHARSLSPSISPSHTHTHTHRLPVSPFFEKTYEVALDGPAPRAALQAWREGLSLTSTTTSRKKIVARTLPCDVTPLSHNTHSHNTEQQREQGEREHLYEFVLREGRNRQLHRMANAFGLQVLRIHRTRFCGLSLQGLARPGEWKKLSQQELGIVNAHVAQAAQR